MNISRSSVARRAVGGAIAGLGLVFGVAAGASADAFVDANGFPIASSGSATVSIVDGEAVIIFGDEADDELNELIASAETNSSTLDESSGLAIADASGGQGNDGFIPD